MRLGSDKKLHFWLTCAGSALVTLANGPLFGTWPAIGLGVVAGLTVAAVKEGYDQQHPERHTADVRDAIAGFTGGVVGSFTAAGLFSLFT